MSKKILIIDDDAAILDVLQIALECEGFHVLTSVHANGFRDLIIENNVDLIVIDYLLKGVNGGEICLQIKCCDELKHLPVILYSAYPLHLPSLNTYGFDVFIPKPFDLGDIVNQINNLFHCTSNQLFVHGRSSAI